MSVKATVCAKRDHRWNPSTCTSIFENSRYLINVVDDSAIACDEIMSVKDSVSTYVTNPISTNATSTVPSTKAKTKTAGALTIYGEWRIYGE